MGLGTAGRMWGRVSLDKPGPSSRGRDRPWRSSSVPGHSISVLCLGQPQPRCPLFHTTPYGYTGGDLVPS